MPGIAWKASRKQIGAIEYAHYLSYISKRSPDALTCGKLARNLMDKTPLKRISHQQLESMQLAVEEAAGLAVPENVTQREAFRHLVPALTVMRGRGCSWDQVASLLNANGFNLKASTVRAYFSEMANG